MPGWLLKQRRSSSSLPPSYHLSSWGGRWGLGCQDWLDRFSRLVQALPALFFGGGALILMFVVNLSLALFVFTFVHVFLCIIFFVIGTL